jgi:hypothetical protein
VFRSTCPKQPIVVTEHFQSRSKPSTELIPPCLNDALNVCKIIRSVLGPSTVVCEGAARCRWDRVDPNHRAGTIAYRIEKGQPEVTPFVRRAVPRPTDGPIRFDHDVSPCLAIALAALGEVKPGAELWDPGEQVRGCLTSDTSLVIALAAGFYPRTEGPLHYVTTSSQCHICHCIPSRLLALEAE